MRPLAEWEYANPGTVHDPGWFRRDVLLRLASVKFSEIVEAAGLLEGVASDIKRGKWTPNVSTWPALVGVLGTAGALVGNGGGYRFYPGARSAADHCDRLAHPSRDSRHRSHPLGSFLKDGVL